MLPVPGASVLKIGARRSHDVALAADHQAVAALEPPDAAARPDVDVVDLLRSQQLHPPHVVLVVASCRRRRSCRPAPCAWQDLSRLARWRRRPAPSPTRRAAAGARARNRRAWSCRSPPSRPILLDPGRVRGVADDLVAALHQATRHVPAHPAEPHSSRAACGPPIYLPQRRGAAAPGRPFTSLPRCTRSTRRPRSRSTWRSPRAEPSSEFGPPL